MITIAFIVYSALDFLCYAKAVKIQRRALCSYWPGSGYFQLWKALRKR